MAVKFELLKNFGFALSTTFSAANALSKQEHAVYADFMTNIVNYTQLDRMKRTKNGRSN
jgi:hypothetical protein